MKTFTSILLAACLVSPVAMADSCRYSRDFNFDVAVAGLEALDIDVGSGYLDIKGTPEADNISVRAKACANSKRQLDDMELIQNQRGDTLEISSEIDTNRFPFTVFSANYAYIDVDISIPAGLSIAIEDGGGDITIANVSGSFEIDDGSGDINIRDVAGDVEIDDGSGDIDVYDVSGDFVVYESGSGDVEYSGVEGRVEVRE